MLKPLRRELKEAERFGMMAVRETVNAAVVKCELKADCLSDLAVSLLQAADRANTKKDDDMTGTYLFLYYNLWDYARDRLSRQEYHLFCDSQTGFEQYWYM